MQADGIPLSRQLRFLGTQCNRVQHKQFADADIVWMSKDTGAAVSGTAKTADKVEYVAVLPTRRPAWPYHLPD